MSSIEERIERFLKKKLYPSLEKKVAVKNGALQPPARVEGSYFCTPTRPVLQKADFELPDTNMGVEIGRRCVRELMMQGLWEENLTDEFLALVRAIEAEKADTTREVSSLIYAMY